ncbi:hypothetical protein BHE74_00009361 [Ensete ventricosum]|nr:hypothetical protein BHE74_00009361 [Ensete ventricosum]
MLFGCGDRLWTPSRFQGVNLLLEAGDAIVHKGSEGYQHHLFGDSGQQYLRWERIQLLRQLRVQESPFELLRDRRVILDLRRVLQLPPSGLHLLVGVLMSQVGHV